MGFLPPERPLRTQVWSGKQSTRQARVGGQTAFGNRISVSCGLVCFVIIEKKLYKLFGFIKFAQAAFIINSWSKVRPDWVHGRAGYLWVQSQRSKQFLPTHTHTKNQGEKYYNAPTHP